MTPPSPPPILLTPPPGEPPQVRVESLQSTAKVVVSIAGVVALFVGSVVKAEYGVDRVAEHSARVAGDLEKHRAESEQRSRESQQANDARFAGLEAQRKADEDQRRKDREELILIKLTLEYVQKTGSETRADVKTLLDRVNAPSPRTRTARDYP